MSRAVDRERATARSPASRPRSRGPLVYRHASSRYSTVHLAFDIFQGIGIAAAVGIRPFLPALAVGALAAGDVQIHFDHTDFAFLQSAPFLLAMVVGAIVLALLERRLAPERLESGAPWLILAAASLALGALFFAGSLCPGSLRDLARDGRRRPVRGDRRRGDASAAGARPRAALGARPRCCRCSPRASALLLAVLSVVAPPVGVIGVLALLLAAVGRPPARGAEVRGAADPAVTSEPAVHQEARAGRDRRAQAVDARARDRVRPRAGARADPPGGRLRRRLRRRVPVGDAGVRGDDHHRRRPRPAPDPEHELVPPRGGALRRVRLELLRQPPVRRAAVADRHRLPDERRAPVPRRRDRVRVARRRRRPDRRHHLPDLPRPPPARGRERDGAGPDRHLDAVPAHDRRPAGAVLRRPLREPQDRLPRPAGDAGDPRPAHRAASAPTWSSTTCSTSCCSRCPTTTPGRTRTARTRRSPRSPPPTASSSG